MEARLQAGQKIETLTQGELRTELEQLFSNIRDMTEPDDFFEIETTMQADSAGVIAQKELYKVRPGFQMALHRYHINAPGATPATPLQTVGAYLFFARNDVSAPGNIFMFIPGSTSQIAPVVIVEGNYSAKVMKGGTTFVCGGGGFVANQVLNISFQCKLSKWDGR